MVCKTKKKSCGSSRRYDHEDGGYEPVSERWTGSPSGLFPSEKRAKHEKKKADLPYDAKRHRAKHKSDYDFEERRGSTPAWVQRAIDSQDGERHGCSSKKRRTRSACATY